MNTTVMDTATPPTELGPLSRTHSALLVERRSSFSSKCCHISEVRIWLVGLKAKVTRVE